MTPYLNLLHDILNNGALKSNRTGIDTLSVFGRQLRFNLTHGFPLLTTKKLHFKSIVYELLWFLRGDTNTKYLRKHGITIWDEWATDEGELGPIYGYQWTQWPTHNDTIINQIDQVIHQIRNNPNSRRILFHAWNPEYLPDESISPQRNVQQGKMALAPCHVLYQFYVTNNQLSSHLYIRSSDVFLGLPYNIASLALLTTMIAHQCALFPGEIVISLGDVHLYHNHLEQAKLQLTRTPLALPTLTLQRLPASIYEYKFTDFVLTNYVAHSHIQASVAI